MSRDDIKRNLEGLGFSGLGGGFGDALVAAAEACQTAAARADGTNWPVLANLSVHQLLSCAVAQSAPPPEGGGA